MIFVRTGFVFFSIMLGIFCVSSWNWVGTASIKTRDLLDNVVSIPQEPLAEATLNSTTSNTVLYSIIAVVFLGGVAASSILINIVAGILIGVLFHPELYQLPFFADLSDRAIGYFMAFMQ